MTTPTYAPPFLQSGQTGQFTPASLDPFAPYALTQQPIGQYGIGQLPFSGHLMGVPGAGVEQVIPSIQVIVQLLGNAQQALWTAQHVAAQLPAYIATVLQQPHHQFAQPRQFSPYQRPYPMAW